MPEKNLSEQILNKIKEEKILPKPRWTFIVKDSLVWFLVIISLLVGSLATAVVIYMVDNNHWDLYERVYGNIWAFFLASLPYFWLIILLIFIIFICYNFLHTKGGYKYRASAVILGSVLISLVLGIIFYNFGLATAIDDLFAGSPFYQKFANRKQIIFDRPEQGILPGQVMQVISPAEFYLQDIDRNIWRVVKTEMIIDLRVENGQRLIVIGEKIDKDVFMALQIRALMPHRQPNLTPYFFIFRPR